MTDAPNYSTFEQLTHKVLSKAAALVMAPTETREVWDQFTMTVHAVRELHPHLRRITFRAEEFATLRQTGPDEYFALLMPPAGSSTVTMPSADRLNVRQAIRKLPEDQQPEMRWYTIRARRPAEHEIDVDFVLHGDAGPGSRWASAAEPGQVVGFRAGPATYRPPGVGTYLLVADETALPALSAILEAGVPAETQVYVEIPSDGYRLPIETDVPVTWLVRGTDAPGTSALAAVGAAELSDVDYAWLCGEAALATGLRRHLVKERGVDRRRILFSGYWRLGQARL